MRDLARIKKDNFVAADAALTDLADSRIYQLPAGSARFAVAGMLSAILAAHGKPAEGLPTATIKLDLALLYGETKEGDAGNSRQVCGRLVVIGRLTLLVTGADLVDAADPVLTPAEKIAGAVHLTATDWAPTAEFEAMETARGETGTGITGDQFKLLCLDRASDVIVKPVLGEWPDELADLCVKMGASCP